MYQSRRRIVGSQEMIPGKASYLSRKFELLLPFRKTPIYFIVLCRVLVLEIEFSCNGKWGDSLSIHSSSFGVFSATRKKKSQYLSYQFSSYFWSTQTIAVIVVTVVGVGQLLGRQRSRKNSWCMYAKVKKMYI